MIVTLNIFQVVALVGFSSGIGYAIGVFVTERRLRNEQEVVIEPKRPKKGAAKCK